MQIVLDRTKRFDMVQNVKFSSKQLFGSDPKHFGPVQTNLGMTKKIWTCPKQFGHIEGQSNSMLRVLDYYLQLSTKSIKEYHSIKVYNLVDKNPASRPHKKKFLKVSSRFTQILFHCL